MATPEPRLLPVQSKSEPSKIAHSGQDESIAAPLFLVPRSGWARAAVRPLLDAYIHANRALARRGTWGSHLAENHALFFALAVLGALLLAPRFLMLGYYVASEIITGGAATKPDTSVVPYTPDIVAVILGAFILGFALPTRWRLAFGLIVSAWWPVVEFGISPLGFAIFAVYVAALYVIAKLRFSRYVVFGLAVVLVAAAFAYLIRIPTIVETGILTVMRQMPIIVPVIWYTMTAEMPGRRHLDPVQHALYHYLRMLGSPVLTFKDVFGPTGDSLAYIRLEGIKALYTVLASVIVIDAIGHYMAGVNENELTGLPLLMYAYLHYVRIYCMFVIVINTVIGALRLFGIPVRNNFNYWLLARTPNEHWRRWNMLMREWIVAFVFFPIMRARRWLFVAVMASLLVSGFLHVLPQILGIETEWGLISIIMAYWVVNGVAIYVFIKIPQFAPGFVERLRFRTNRVWWAVGVVFTSAFYGVLVHARTSCRTWDQVGAYFERLLGA